MAHDSEYFRRRAAEARSAAFTKEDGEGVEVAGHLALAYSALARRRLAASTANVDPADPGVISASDSEPLMLRD